MASLIVSVIGFGYVGFTTAVCFASRGLPVYGYDVDKEKIAKINRGIAPFHEPKVTDLLEGSLQSGLKASSDRLELRDINFITVGTPEGKDGAIDLSYVKSVSETIGKALKNLSGYRLIVVKSTVVPGTTEDIVKTTIESFARKEAGKDFGLAMNPEFLREGSAVQDMFQPDRLVIGEYDKKSGDLLEELYRVFYGEKIPPLLRTNIVNAEFIKYANNAFLATKISFANTIANIAQRVPGADVTVIARGIALYNSTRARFLNAGVGFGGSCFPKDVEALVAFSKQKGYDPIILEDSYKVNVSQPLVAVEMARTKLGMFRGNTIAILGLSFKPNTDDIREAVSLPIIKEILRNGGKVVAYDHVAKENTMKVFGNKINYAKSALEAIDGADCCILVTEWDEFRQLRPKDFLSKMKNPIVIDGRRIYDPNDFRNSVKFSAIGMGE